MLKNKIAIVGAGLAGLNCARLLENDFDVTLFDQNPRVGGRILSDREHGHILDHGFQVFLPNYPEARKAFNYNDLDLMEFTPGALIRLKSRFYKFSDPARQPIDILSTLTAPLGNLKDKFLILKLKRAVRDIDPKLKKISTYNYLKNFGFSESIIDHFFKPFFSGVFLERELNTSAYFFSFLFSLFSKSKATIPRNGMIELPNNLANQLRNTEILLNSKVSKITNKSVTVNDNELEFDYVVSAYDNQSSSFRLVTTHYFETQRPLASRPTLYLNGSKDGVINHIAPITLVNPNYSSSGRFLWSVNILEPNQEAPIKTVQDELSEWFDGATFKHVKSFSIKKALPKLPSFGSEDILKEGIYQCGDQMQDPSINGALKSGRLVAELILSDKNNIK